MALPKITETQMNENGVIAAPDILTGNPQENKALFDRMVRQLLAPAYNECAEAVDTINAAQEDWTGKEQTRQEQEQTRQEQETARQTAEGARVEAERTRETNEQGRTAAEQLRTDAENGREQAEALRSAAEETRAAAEKERADSEASRKTAENARIDGEKVRQSSETGRIGAESERIASEKERKTAESTRNDDEEKRRKAETQRATAEGERATAEETRESNERSRENREAERQTAEAGRVEAEQARQNAEGERAFAEEKRAAAETARAVFEPYDGTKAYVPGNKVAYGGSSYLNQKACNGIAPTDTEYWLLIAKKGADGDGKGDMVKATYDQDGKETDVYRYVDDAVAAHNASSGAHSDIRTAIGNKQDAISDLATIRAGAEKGATAVQGSSVGIPGGVAGLGTDGKVPEGQLPEISAVKTYTATIGTTWTEDEDTGVKTQNVAISGVLASHTATIDHVYTGSGTSEDYAAFVEAENQYLTYITNGYAETYTGGVKITIFGDAPTVEIPIIVEVA